MRSAFVFSFVALTCVFCLLIGSDLVFSQKPTIERPNVLVDEKDKPIYDSLWKEIHSYIDGVNAAYSIPNLKGRLGPCYAKTRGQEMDGYQLETEILYTGRLRDPIENLHTRGQWTLLKYGVPPHDPVQVLDVRASEQRFKDFESKFRESMEGLINSECEALSLDGEKDFISEQFAKNLDHDRDAANLWADRSRVVYNKRLSHSERRSQIAAKLNETLLSLRLVFTEVSPSTAKIQLLAQTVTGPVKVSRFFQGVPTVVEVVFDDPQSDTTKDLTVRIEGRELKVTANRDPQDYRRFVTNILVPAASGNTGGGQ